MYQNIEKYLKFIDLISFHTTCLEVPHEPFPHLIYPLDILLHEDQQCDDKKVSFSACQLQKIGMVGDKSRRCNSQCQLSTSHNSFHFDDKAWCMWGEKGGTRERIPNCTSCGSEPNEDWGGNGTTTSTSQLGCGVFRQGAWVSMGLWMKSLHDQSHWSIAKLVKHPPLTQQSGTYHLLGTLTTLGCSSGWLQRCLRWLHAMETWRIWTIYEMLLKFICRMGDGAEE